MCFHTEETFFSHGLVVLPIETLRISHQISLFYAIPSIAGKTVDQRAFHSVQIRFREEENAFDSAKPDEDFIFSQSILCFTGKTSCSRLNHILFQRNEFCSTKNLSRFTHLSIQRLQLHSIIQLFTSQATSCPRICCFSMNTH